MQRIAYRTVVEEKGRTRQCRLRSWEFFIGGVCYAHLNGMDIFEGVKFATCCSAKTVCKIGGQSAMPTLEEVKEIL